MNADRDFKAEATPEPSFDAEWWMEREARAASPHGRACAVR